MRVIAFSFLLLVAACATAPSEAGRRTIDIAAERWVRMALEIETHEEGYVDAYFGPESWRTEAERNPRSVEELMNAAHQLAFDLRGVLLHDDDQDSVQRARFLHEQVESALFRLGMLEGMRAPFRQEAEALFAMPILVQPLESYDAPLARIEALLPGAGSPAERMSAFRARSEIPADRAQAVMERAIAECRARTAAHLDLPANEAFRLEFVTGQSWGAYNWYQGDNRSLIQINMDRPLQIASALGYGCHEGYPGHHVQGIYNERNYEERGWVEYSLMPLYGPMSPLAEAAGNYGIALAFPGEQRLAFERDVLYPLAGLDPQIAVEHAAMREELDAMSGVGVTIAAMYLDGEIDRARALELKQRYQLMSPQAAEQSLRFVEHYRAYVVNYDLGEQRVREYVERQGDTPEARWAAFERLMTRPTLPLDLSP